MTQQSDEQMALESARARVAELEAENERQRLNARYLHRRTQTKGDSPMTQQSDEQMALESAQMWVEFATQTEIEQMMRALLQNQRGMRNTEFFQRCMTYSTAVLTTWATLWADDQPTDNPEQKRVLYGTTGQTTQSQGVQTGDSRG